MYGATALTIAAWSAALISSAVTKAAGSGRSSPGLAPSRWRYRRQAWSSTAYSLKLPSASRFLRV